MISLIQRLSKSKIKNLFGILIMLSFAVRAQSDSSLKKVSCDCADAVRIPVFKKARYGFTKAPEGFGLVQEIKARANSVKTAFEQEHNTAWYLLEIKNDGGEMVFDITPKDKTNDYDFLLFPYKDSLTCKDIVAEKIKPLRGNLSRNDTNNLGITGLSGSVKNEFNGKGIGAQFSKSIEVKKGDRFLLVLDNVYDSGKGHKIEVRFIKEISISGQVTDDEGKPMAADVSLYDDKGVEVMKTSSNKDGEYKLNATVTEHVDYSLNITAENFFMGAEVINTDLLLAGSKLVNLKTVLPRLRKGGKYKMGNLNFWGDSHVLVPRSTPTLNYLYLLMKKNKNMKIQIEGHVNGETLQGQSTWQQLSDRRADTVYQYLKNRGIDEIRMSKIGHAAKQMLYPRPMNSYEQEANRRVEIKVISLD